MIRKVDLLNYLPYFVQQYREMRNIINAEEPEIQSIENDSEIIKDNMFIFSTDETGITRYEKMLGLIGDTEEALYDRQLKILAKYTNTVNCTLKALQERLDLICGVGNYQIYLESDKYTISVEIALIAKNMLNIVIKILTDMIPANLFIKCWLMYNTHNILAQYPQYLLNQFTHIELREDVLSKNVSATCDNLTNYTAEIFETINCDNVYEFGMRKV